MLSLEHLNRDQRERFDRTRYHRWSGRTAGTDTPSSDAAPSTTRTAKTPVPTPSTTTEDKPASTTVATTATPNLQNSTGIKLATPTATA